MEWDCMDFDFDDCLAIDFSSWKRCLVISKETVSNNLLKLIVSLDNYESMMGEILLSFPWNHINVQPNDIVSIYGKYEVYYKSFVISNDYGLLIVNPDYLISTTKISQSLFCQRKGVLSEKFQINSVGNQQMIVGVLVHELFQKALSSVLISGIKPNLEQMCDELLNSRELAFKCYESLLSINMVKEPLLDFVQKIKEFIVLNIKNPLQENQNNKQGSCLKIDKIDDIEENIWSPNLGLKGKVDVTVHLHGRSLKNRAPFELKTGRPSIEHRAQIMLYVQMMKLMNVEINSGILYYLQEKTFSEIEAKHNEIRDLILVRNSLVHYLSRYETNPISCESQKYRLMMLPTPLTRENVCENCDVKLVCAVYQCCSANSDSNYPIQNIGDRILRHLSKEDLNYFFKWSEILLMEEEAFSEDQNCNELWTQTPWKRFEHGKALIELKLTNVQKNDDGSITHSFLASSEYSFDHICFEIGQLVIISTSNRIAITTGILTCYKAEYVEVSLERDLSLKYSSEKFIIDKYSSRNLLSFSYGNIAMLMEDTPLSNNLRRTIVDKLPSEYAFNVDPILTDSTRLNENQRRIVEKAISCKNYMVIKGYAGTGKTETIVAMIHEFQKQNKSVIITSHTHSAIDNILVRIRKRGLEFLRIGKLSRVKPELKNFSDSFLTKDCKSPSEFEAIYSKYRIVAATCYGITHPLFSRRTFDVCIVDEATQVTQPLILRSLLCAKKFILVGDPFQLPPVIKSPRAKELGGDQSLFCWLDNDDQNNELTFQYRMNAQIGKLANEFTYKNRLIVGENQTTLNICGDITQFCWEKRVFSSQMCDATLFIDTGHAYERNLNLIQNPIFSHLVEKLPRIGNNIGIKRKIYVNVLEAVLVLHLVTKFLKSNIKVENIGVIATYRSQVDCIKSMVKNHSEYEHLEINTVDQYQGRDKQIIIYSCTKCISTTDIKRASSSNEILDDPRRLTVAVTRAKQKLIIIGDSSSMLENAPFEQLFECLANGMIQLSDSFYDFELPQIIQDLPTIDKKV